MNFFLKYKIKARVLAAALFCPFGVGAILAVETVTLPSAAPGGGSSVLLNEIRLQDCYTNALFPLKAVFIKEIRFRPSPQGGVAFTNTLTLDIRLSTTRAIPEKLSRTFSENPGPDETVVFQGSLELSSKNLGVFDIQIPFTTPFYYNPSKGNLLIDIRNFSGGGPVVDASGNGDDGAGRAFALGADSTEASGADEGVDILQLVISDALRVEPIEILPLSGDFTNSAIAVTLTSSLSNAVIHYTLDGSIPNLSSSVYSDALQFTNSITVRAQAYVGFDAMSEILTSSYRKIYAIADGISAAWRQQYFGPGYLTDPRVVAESDPDGDGATNMEEFRAKTNPLDPLSFFRILEIHPAPVIRWSSVSGVRYRILKRHLNETNWASIGTLIRATSNETFFSDVTEKHNPSLIYQVEVVP